MRNASESMEGSESLESTTTSDPTTGMLVKEAISAHLHENFTQSRTEFTNFSLSWKMASGISEAAAHTALCAAAPYFSHMQYAKKVCIYKAVCICILHISEFTPFAYAYEYMHSKNNAYMHCLHMHMHICIPMVVEPVQVENFSKE